MIGLWQVAQFANHLTLQFLPNLPTNGTAPATPYTTALELVFIFGGALIALYVILKDPINPRSRKAREER